MFGNDTPIFRFRGPMGVPVEIGSSILFLGLLFVGLGSMTPQSLTQDLALFAMVVASIFLHEFGHAWGCHIQGVPIKKVMIYGGGGYCQHAQAPPRETELIVAMGPIVNLALWALASLGAWWLLQDLLQSLQNLTPDSAIANEWRFSLYGYLQTFALINLVLLALNMFPVQPLDGGKLFHLGLMRFLPPMVALRFTGAVGLVFAVLWIPGMLLLYFQFGWMLLFIPPIRAHLEMAKGNLPV